MTDVPLLDDRAACPGCGDRRELICRECQRGFCPNCDASAVEPEFCPLHQDPFAQLDAWRRATQQSQRTA